MNSSAPDQVTVDATFLNDVLAGLGKPSKELSCKYFYDERGSLLFDEICQLEEYYLTRTEQQIMDQYAGEMADQLGAGVMLVEFGSGSSTKTRVLLEHLESPAAYVPLDISEDHLLNTARELRDRFPEIEILPVVADFTEDFRLPIPQIRPSHSAIYFPGSTIGNFAPARAVQLLTRIGRMLGVNGGLLIGIDLQKEPEIIRAAYNDAQGITAEFNLNILRRINDELGADFDLDQFEHLAEYDAQRGRIEIWIVSKRNQTVRVGNRAFEFAEGEKLFTEFSHKYTIDGFAEMARQAGFILHRSWTDEQNRFAVLHLVIEQSP